MLLRNTVPRAVIALAACWSAVCVPARAQNAPTGSPSIEQLESSLASQKAKEGALEAKRRAREEAMRARIRDVEREKIASDAIAQWKAQQESEQMSLQITNNCDKEIVVAVIYLPLESRQWLAEGWWKIAPGDSLTFPFRTMNSKAYYYAHTSDGAEIWSGTGDNSYSGSVPNDAFTVGVPNSISGFNSYSFRPVRLTGNPTRQSLSCNN